MKNKSQISIEDKSFSIDNLSKKYIFIAKFFFIISVLLLILVLVVAMGISLLKMGPDWAVITLEYWIIIWCVVTALFIILELIFYFYYISKEKKVTFEEEVKSEFIHGKKVYVYTYPPSVKGGIFSKTYIEIDNSSVLRLRSLMIPPRDLWKK